MADINATDLPRETKDTIEGTECLVGFDSAEGKQIAINEFAAYLIDRKTNNLIGADRTISDTFTKVAADILSNKINIKNVYVSVTSSSAYTRYGYEQKVPWPGVKATSFVDVMSASDSFSGAVGIEPSENMVTLYFTKNPGSGVIFDLFAVYS